MVQSRLSLVLCALLAAILLITITPTANALSVYVEAKDEQCFFDYVYKGDKVVGTYLVADGGNLDIDLRVLGPDGKVIYEKERTNDGSFQFKSIEEGVHNLCFNNRMSTISGKLISFNLYVGDALHKRDAASKKNLTPLETAIVKTSEGMHGVRDQISYSKMREERHTQTTNSTNSRVLLWSLINLSAVVIMAVIQILTIRGFFETKRKV